MNIKSKVECKFDEDVAVLCVCRDIAFLPILNINFNIEPENDFLIKIERHKSAFHKIYDASIIDSYPPHEAVDISNVSFINYIY
jgi:hypothetical protein